MLQIATFQLPDEQDEANEFLRTHKPMGNIEFTKDILFMGYEDGTYPVEYQIGDLQELIAGQRNARLQQEVALHVMGAQLADLTSGSQKTKRDELSEQMRQMRAGMDLQDIKIAFVESKIAALRDGTGNPTGPDA